MRCTITEYKTLPRNPVGAPFPNLAQRERLAAQTQTAVGAFAALNADTRYVRIATDTNVIVSGTNSPAPELFTVGAHFLEVSGGETLTTAAA